MVTVIRIGLVIITITTTKIFFFLNACFSTEKIFEMGVRDYRRNLKVNALIYDIFLFKIQFLNKIRSMFEIVNCLNFEDYLYFNYICISVILPNFVETAKVVKYPVKNKYTMLLPLL